MKQLKLPFVFFFASLIMISCSINEPQMPRWDVSLNIPIAKKSYTMMELLEKSNELSYYKDGSNVLYYSQVKSIEKIDLKDKLKVDAVSKSVTETIGMIDLASDSVSANVGYTWISAGLSGGMQVIVPPINDYPLTVTTAQANDFSSAKVDAGTIDFSITNNFSSPVTLTVKNVVLKNLTGGETIAQYTGTITIPAKQTTTVKALSLVKGVTIRNQLTMDCLVSTNGSGGAATTLPPNSFSIKAKFQGLSVSETQAKIPAQDPIVIDNTVVVDEIKTQPTKFTSMKIESGTLNMRVVNNLDIDATLTLTINNIKNPSGQTFSATHNIARKQTATLYNNFSLVDYSIVSLNGTPTNQVSYKITFQTKSTADFRTIKSTDGINATLDLSTLRLKEFSGLISPTTVASQRSAIALDLKDLKNKLQFQELNLKRPIVQLRLRTNAQYEFRVDGKIEARNSLGQKATISLSSRTLNTTLLTPSDSVLTINSDSLSLFFKKFTRLPDSLIVYAGGTLNPNYKTVTLKNTDQIYGRSIFELPMELGIAGAQVSDSVSIDITNDDRDKLKDVNSIEAGVILTNGLPASITFTGKLYDAQNRFLSYFPPKYANQDTVITFGGAATDASGNASTKNKQTKTVIAQKAEIDKLLNAKYMRVNIKLNTTAPSNSAVRFRTTDDLLIHAFGSTNYRINP